jgi:S-methylmethionine-dependent homocysteine/selenocysteine methylase
MFSRAEFAARLETGPVLILDGATGTELERQGIHAGLPLWSAHALLDAPESLEAIHRAYVEAGAEAITANTFRTQARTLARGGMGKRAEELTQRAVDLARRASGRRRSGELPSGRQPPRQEPAGRRAWVLGSAPPLEDCYRPERVPDPDVLQREHSEHAANLARAGVDAILAETHNTVREAQAAVAAARATGLPVLVSFVCDAEARLLSGEPLAAALDAVASLGPNAVGVNCLPPSHVDACLQPLADLGLPFGVQANLGAPGDIAMARREHDCTPEDFARHAAEWCSAGASWVGGCCGTTPAHLRAVVAQTRV